MTPSIVKHHLILAVAAALACGSGAHAQNAPPPARDWNGIWEHQGTLMFDPTVGKYGKPEVAPLTPEYQRRFTAALAARARGEQVNDPTAKCLPQGMPRMMIMTFPMEVFMTPGQVTIFAEWNSQIRRIYTDGKDHPHEPDATWNGYSTGHWEGDTLVADTVDVRQDNSIDSSPLEHSDKLKIHERIRLVDKDTLEDEMTLIDPVAFTKPWTEVRRYKRNAKIYIMDYACDGKDE